MIHLEFLGALNSVGRSAVFVDTGTEKIMMDYGTKIREVPPLFPIPIKGKPDAVLLSHSHLDHNGGLPIFVANGNGVPIYALNVTKPLTELLLLDSLKISAEEGIKLPFNKKDIKITLNNFVPVDFKKPFKVHSAKVTYYDAGHIPGSAMTLLEAQGKKILYTGDIQSIESSLMHGFDAKSLPEFDCLITESTYAQRDHPPREEQEDLLLEIVEGTIANGGIVLISGFAIGRLQELLLVLHKKKIDYPLYMDGMAKKATTIINKFSNLTKNPGKLDEALKKVEYVHTEMDRKRIIKNPCVILTTSGMLTGGAVVWYLKKLYNDRKSSLVLSGYQLPDTPGKILLETGRYVAKDVSLEVKMQIRRLDFSGHIGKTDLSEFIKSSNPEKVFCVHGDHTEEFAFELKQQGFDAVAPLANNRVFQI